MILKDNFTKEYASTEIEPTDNEKEYVFSILHTLDETSPDYTNVNGVTFCDCVERIEEDVQMDMFVVPIPFVEEDFEEERNISIILCTNCGKWSMCD